MASGSPAGNVRQLRSIALSLLAAIVLAACANDKIVYRDRQPFNNPPAAAQGFLGYYDVATQQTTCGNCHSGYQAKWVTTKHAKAWANLQAASGKSADCEGCHTLNTKGNAVTTTAAGYDAVKENTYHDVQCESCHGPGLTHVEGVGQGSIVRPLAKISLAGTGNCGDCHSGAHQPFVEEWKASGHANLSVSRASNATCRGCHDGRKALERFDPDVNYKEKDGATDYQPTVCAVCHNPHGSTNPNQLRFPVTSANPEENLCMQCHLRRIEPEFDAITPHAPQGAMLLGFAGWRPPGFVYDTARIFGTHATTANPKLCAGCHAGRFTVTDKLTGAFTFQATGHLFRPIPCLDATGKPTGDKTCAYTETARSWQTCTASGCHGTPAAAVNAFTTVRNRMKFLADQLWQNKNNDGTLQATPTDGGMLATLKATRPTEWSNTDNQVTPAEGAEFNSRLCGEYNQSNADNSKGVHNPFLCEALLVATINYVRSYYGLAAASVGIQAQLNGAIVEKFDRSQFTPHTQPR